MRSFVMTHKIGIYYNEPGIREIMKGQGISQIEQQIMTRKLSQIKADFLQQFGFEGQFDIKAVTTNSRRSRITYRIVPANARTTAALKRQPGWIAKYL